MRRTLAILLTLGTLAGASACRTTASMDQKFFEEVGSLSKEEILARGDAFAERKKWEDARKYYAFVADSFPNDPVGREAALKIADTFYRAKDVESQTEAQLRYKDFVNRFPNDVHRPYALLMLGKTHFERQRGALRDLTPLKEALSSFQQVIELYPDSEYATEARELARQTIDTLAEHELEVAEYYSRTHALRGARNRLRYLLDNYPGSSSAEQATQLLAEVETKMEEARQAATKAEKHDGR